MRRPSATRAPVSILIALAVCSGAGCGVGPAPAELISEAEAFMAAYANDLLAEDRGAIAGRYDPRGAYLMGHGEKEMLSADSILAIYEGAWEAPEAFSWNDLSYEVVGPDAVVVLGLFDCEGADGRTLRVSYTGLLVRQDDGAWRIRVEDESVTPETIREMLCPEETEPD